MVDDHDDDDNDDYDDDDGEDDDNDDDDGQHGDNVCDDEDDNQIRGVCNRKYVHWKLLQNCGEQRGWGDPPDDEAISRWKKVKVELDKNVFSDN